MAEYFDDRHRHHVQQLQSGWTARTEWPTWLLIVVVHGGWAGTLWAFGAHRLPLPVATAVLVVVCAWHTSLQHELLHGHPTRSASLNRLLGYAPFAVWYPYTLYRDLHLRHHRDDDLTMPGVDPESNYVLPQHWARMSAPLRALWTLRKRFVGRLLIGPPMAVALVFAHTLADWRRGDFRYLPMWLLHGVTVAAMLAWIEAACGLRAWYYLLAVTWPAHSLAMVRSLFEHRAAPSAKARITINEAGPLMRLLFLNNNYHLVHHDLPSLPWYQLGRVYRARRTAYARKCGGFVIRGGYWQLFRQYAFVPTDAVVHPYAPPAYEVPPRFDAAAGPVVAVTSRV